MNLGSKISILGLAEPGGDKGFLKAFDLDVGFHQVAV